MKLYEVTNGYLGFSYVRCYVIAESEERAVEIAREKYKAASIGYKDAYYNNLTAEVMCENTSEEYASNIMD